MATLDQIVQTLRDNAHITQVEIEGHTDAAGLVDMNLRLSQRRAEAVRSYLVEQGIDEARLLPVGYGQEKPIADNDTFEGREQNRRVEFRILRRGDG
jgi:OOP family OmpA-OmpF porin